MGEKCWYWISCIASSLGIYFGVTIFFLFTFYYHNVNAGAWGLISAIFAATCLHLRLLSQNNRLVTWYTAGNLTGLAVLGFFSFCISLGFTIWYIVYASYHKIPMMPVETSYYLTAVWSFMTVKWTLTLFILSYRYARLIRYNSPFLITSDPYQS